MAMNVLPVISSAEYPTMSQYRRLIRWNRPVAVSMSATPTAACSKMVRRRSSLWRSAVSTCLRSEMSRQTERLRRILPVSSRTAETFKITSIFEPSLRRICSSALRTTPVVRNCSKVRCASARQPGSYMSETGRPRTSSPEYPNVSAKVRLHCRMRAVSALTEAKQSGASSYRS